MFGGLIKRIFGTSHQRMMRKIQPLVVQINAWESEISALSDDELKGKTPVFKERLANGEPLDSLIPEAFAVVREASKRVLEMRHYDVQMIGGVVLHRGMIAEMKTGEGKTLVATCPLYLNALLGRGAHLVTVNDYLADRDADWMGKIYKFLGLSVGKILTDMPNADRHKSYASDITYGTNNEFGFDYLRDNMKFRIEDYVQRDLAYAIVDEVDSILIDEARTPLIISGQIEQDLELYFAINKMVPFLKRDEDYSVDEKQQSVALNETGIEKIEKHLGVDNIYEPKYIEYLHHVNKALQAHTLYKRDQNYVVDGGKVIIVDDFTGRLMPGRRWSDGLHQAIEAKEGVEIQSESQTLATITFQNYFRMYDKLAGMTGTADTEAEEFKKIYKLDVVSIPTNETCVRKDLQDVVYRTEREKIAAIVKQIEECQKSGQPALVGTVNVEKSEVISKVLEKKGIVHNVLNAKNHKREAEIIAQAGRKGAVTIATNMAGRGTDILLGGNPSFMARQEVGTDEGEEFFAARRRFVEACADEKREVIEAGGLFILGTERHESRRIDNQLRGRAGRQGDPGASRFFLSLEDDLMRIFGAERLSGMMERMGMEAGVPIEAGMVTRAIEGAQKRVEGRNFDYRKNVLEYDDVMNAQRKAIYGLRLRILEGYTLEDELLDAFEDVLIAQADKFMDVGVMYEDWDFDSLIKAMTPLCGFELVPSRADLGRGDRDGHLLHMWTQLEEAYQKQIDQFDEFIEVFEKELGDASPYKDKTGKDLLLELSQSFILREIDTQWREHLNNMAALRDAIGLRGYAQKDPKQEYKREAFTVFEEMMLRIKSNTMMQVFRVQVEKPRFAPKQEEKPKNVQNATMSIEQNASMQRTQSLASSQSSQAQSQSAAASQSRQTKTTNVSNASRSKRKTKAKGKKSASMKEMMSELTKSSKAVDKKAAASMASLLPPSIAKAMKEAIKEGQDE
ncbi:MAG: preprotein translocase subunit SecA [Bradymonadales bacterium]